MHLRSGATIASGSQVPSRASTHSSKNVAAEKLLDPIIEDYATTSSSEESESMSSMSNQPGGCELGRATNSNVDLLGNPTTLLIFNYLNKHGAHVFSNQHQECAVWENSQGDTNVPPSTMEVTNHGDHYMDSRGYKFLKTTRPQEMDCWGNLAIGQQAFSEPVRALRPLIPTLTNEPKARQFPAPSAPPMFQSQRQQGLPPTLPEIEVTSRSPMMRKPSPQIPIASVQGKAIVSKMFVYRLYTDQSSIALYEDAHGNLFTVPLQLYGYHPMEVTLNVYESQGGRTGEYIDNWGNTFTMLMGEQAQSLTWQGVPISHQRIRVQGQSNLGANVPAFPPTLFATPKHVEFETPSFPYNPVERTNLMGNLCDPMSHINLGETARNFETVPVPSHLVTGISGAYRPPFQMAREQSRQRVPVPTREPSVPLPRATGPRMRGNGLTYVAPTSYRQEPMLPAARAPRFRQVLYVEDVEDVHTMVQGFGLTLEGRALRWFQSLSNATLYDLETLVKAFIKENTKTGIKHNTLTQILDFKQKERETVKDAIARLKSLISRCPPREMPAEDRLISCFLESLRDRNLHTQLFERRHVTLDDCFDDALLYEDNCSLGGADAKEGGSDSSSHTSRHVNSETIVDLILRKLRQEQGYPSNGGYPRAYVCGISSGNHPTGSCQREGNALASGLVWCDVCKKYCTHTTKNCYYQARAANVQSQPRNDQRDFPNRENPKVGGNAERHAHVLGTQPPLRGAATVRYVDVTTNDLSQNQDLVPVGSYYEEEYDYLGHYSDELRDDPRELMFVNQGPPREPPMGRGRQSSAPRPGPCFKCGGTDHWARECQNEKSGTSWPRVERFCAECHIEHLSKDCPNRPNTSTNQPGPSTSSLHLIEMIPSPSTSGSDEIASLRVVTRAQAREGVPLEQEPTKTSSKQRRVHRRKRRTPRNVAKSDPQKSLSANEKEKTHDSTSSSDKGGSVTIDRIDDPLQAVKIAMDNRVAMKDQSGRNITQNGSQITTISEWSGAHHRREPNNEELATQLWEEVREKLKGKTEDVKSPLTSIAHTEDANRQLEAIPSVSGDWESETMVSSPDPHLDTLPNYLGEYEARSEVFPIPTARSMKNKEQKDGANLQALMSVPVTCTLPLADLLKVRPDLWENIAGLSKMGEFCKKHNIEHKGLRPTGRETMKVPINTVAYMPKADETGNTTLPLEHNDYKAIAILDTRAGVSIATKSVWETWGKRALKKTRMQLRLADGKMAKPLGIMEYVSVTSCGGIKYEHSFVIVDFETHPNYEVILGRPFMRQLMVIQDWGYNYLYLRHDGVTTRVNLSTHEYRDVAKLPVADFESATTSKALGSKSNQSEEGDIFLLCDFEKMDQMAQHSAITDQKIIELSIQTPQDDINDDEASQEWMHILATIDTCALPLATRFCDEDGYDIVPIRVVTPVNGIEPTHAEDSFDGKTMDQGFDQETPKEKAKCRARKNQEKEFHIGSFSTETGDGDCDPPLLVKLNVHQATLTDERIEELKNLGSIAELDEEDASQEWMHLLATIDTCAIPSQTDFCDEDGYDVVPIRVITPVFTMEATLEDESSQAEKILKDLTHTKASSKQRARESKIRTMSQEGSPARWEAFNFKEDMGTAMGMCHLQALLQKLQETQDNPNLAPSVHNLLATRDLELRYNTRFPSRLGEPLPEEGQERGTSSVPLREKTVPLSPRPQREEAMEQPCQEPLTMTLDERGKHKERSISPKQGKKQRISQEPSSRRRRSSSHGSTSSSRSGRNPHGRFYKERKNAPSPPHDSSPSDDTLSSSSSDESSSSSSMEERRKK
ncbi:hypothetical protein L7F22_000285 [Adiantum nelumboides]|nr:hypothetical protein [Adiantum nelumboides]